MMDADLHERIRRRAYLLWEQAGRPEGQADDFWRRAEAEEALQGASETQEQVCPACQGKGRIGRKKCTACGGTGSAVQP